MEFTEDRRLNKPTNFNEASLIHTQDELVKLYEVLQDPTIPRSAPLPPFDEKTETIIVLSPQLKILNYGDIEVQNIQNNNSSLLINYKEVTSVEFSENKWKNPIIILRVLGKFSEININRIN